MKIFDTKIKKALWISAVAAGVWGITEIIESRQITQCMQNAMVWDYDESRCREDCLKWGEGFGCIKLTAEETEQIKRCRDELNCITDEMVRTICLRNGKAYNEDTRNCRYTFQSEMCYKLSGNWTYPSDCEK